MIEFAAFRPLRTASPLAKLAASLGVLLVAQAAVSLAFGIGTKPQPPVLPRDTITVFGATVPVDRLILPGIVLLATLALSLLFRLSRFGLATRAASENEVGAMLLGLSPNQLALANTLLATLVAGGLGVLAASITQLDSTSLPLQVVPALTAALFARFTSFWIAALVGLAIGMLENILYYLQTFSWFPTDNGVAMPGVQPLLVFVLMVVAMFLRGTNLPTRGELVEQRLPLAPRAQQLWKTAVVATAAAVVALIVLPYDFRQALITSLLATVMCLSLVVITGFVGQISVVQLALAGVSGFILSHLAADHGVGFPWGMLIGARRRHGLRSRRRRLGAARPRRQPRGRHARRRGRDRAVRLPEHDMGRRQLELAGARAEVSASTSDRTGRSGGSTERSRARCSASSSSRSRSRSGCSSRTCGGRPRAAHARGPLERARGGRGRHQRPQRQARRIRDQLVHRRDRRRALRLQLQLGHGDALLGPDRAQPDRVRLRRRHHDGRGGDLRRPHLRRGAVSVRAREVVRDLGQLGAARSADWL